MKKRILIFLSVLIFLLLLIPLKKGDQIEENLREGKKVVEFFGVKLYTNKEIFCQDNICTTEDGKIKIISNKEGFIAYVKEGNIKIELPAKYIIIRINGKEYYRRLQKNEELKLLKEFSLYGEGKYDIKLRNGPQGRYPILFSGNNSTYIDVYFDREGKLILKKYL